MLRILGFACLLALCAGAARADEPGSDISRANAALTEQLNARITRGVVLDAPVPPAKADDGATDAKPPRPGLRASR